MAGKHIVHCMHAEKFIQQFTDFLFLNFSDFEIRHKIFITGDLEKYSIKMRSNMLSSGSNKLLFYAKISFAMNSADKVIIHGLFNINLVILLFMQPWLLRKCYWVVWGGDLYSYQHVRRAWLWCRNEFFRRFVIRRLGHFITHIRGDYELARKWYGTKGIWHECFTYPSNLYYELPLPSIRHDGVNILLGNSADPSNNHIDALEKLRPHATQDIKIFCPLSYGDAVYARRVADYGESIFGAKFIPIIDFMSLNDYNKMLSKIDIGIFNHGRQQGMGNIVTLLGMGKKVFMRNDITSWDALRGIGVEIFDINDFNLNLIADSVLVSNRKKIAEYFSKSRLKTQLADIFS